MSYILKGCGLTKIYKQGDRSVTAVDNCNLCVEKGKFTVIVGASGSGKSTLLHLLAALEQPTSGELWVDGKNIYALNESELSRFRNTDIGFVFQNYYLLPVLTAKENILMPALISGKPISQTYLMELCETLGLTDRLCHLPSELSGGQQQRVAVARAMINIPKIIFADEPTGNLDKASASELIDMLLASVRKFHCTVLMVTHDSCIAERADCVYEMDDGKIKQIK